MHFGNSFTIKHAEFRIKVVNVRRVIFLNGPPRWSRWRVRLAVLLAVSLAVSGGGCFTGQEGEAFYGRVIVPRSQEFRWCDGGLPQIFDPGLAAAAPDTDAVRALYEGLTDYEPRTLKPVPGVALSWESSTDHREWIFRLRRDARWSNGEEVTARDFVNSWQRTLNLGDRAPHAKLLDNILGARRELPGQSPPDSPARVEGQETAQVFVGPRPTPTLTPPRPEPFGVESLDEHTLRVRLRRPDQNFPALVAHPVFRPLHRSQLESESVQGDEVQETEADATKSELVPRQVVSNGAFRLSQQGTDGVVLERAGSYWNTKKVALDRVRFVAARNAEDALAAYRAGEVDAVTNTNVEPLAVKLLAPYQDFRRSTFGAVTYYQFNTANSPFDDLRVRQALTLAVERERLSLDTLKGASEPADSFFPGDGRNTPHPQTQKIASHDPEKARQLLAEAGYSGGAGFPRIRLLVNRNDQHRTVAQAIADMWRGVLGIETEMVAKNWEEYEAAFKAGDYDIARRGIVMQTLDEETNLLAMFAEGSPVSSESLPAAGVEATATTAAATPDNSPEPSPFAVVGQTEAELSRTMPAVRKTILTETQALAELPAMPIYFATSFALVKPYVNGFDSNLLDAPSLQHVRMDTNWQLPKQDATISLVRDQ